MLKTLVDQRVQFTRELTIYDLFNCMHNCLNYIKIIILMTTVRVVVVG